MVVTKGQHTGCGERNGEAAVIPDAAVSICCPEGSGLPLSLQHEDDRLPGGVAAIVSVYCTSSDGLQTIRQ